MNRHVTQIAARITLGVAALGAALPVWADDPIVMGDENRVIEAGVEYLIPSYKTSSGVYTSPKASKIFLDGAQDFKPYADADHSDPIMTNNLDNTGMMKWFMAEEGVTYYFYTGFAFNTNTFVLYQDEIANKPLKISLMQPNQDHAVDFKNYPDLEITFNQDVTIAERKASITFANRLTNAKEVVSTNANASGQLLRVTIYNSLKPYLQSGAIKTNDEYVVTIPGLSSASGEPYADADANGNAVFTFLCGSLPVVATQQSVPDPFLSYWTPGAPEGILSMTFDAPIIDDGKTYVELGWGNQEGDGEYYAEQLPVTINGNTLTADFTGKLRTPATMTPQFPNASYPNIIVSVKNVRDEHGVPVASPGAGTTGSYGFYPAYKLIDRTNLIAEFTPASGSLLTDVNNINVWMTGLEAIEFDGFLLTVTDNDNKVSTHTILLDDVKTTTISKNEAEYDFALPADVKNNAKRVEISLSGVKSLDGYDHNNEVRCVYGGFAVMYSEPANGEEIEILKEGTKVMIETNISDIYPSLYVEYQIIDTDPENTDPIVKSSSWMNRDDDGAYTAEIPQDIKLYAGHDYKVLFTAWVDEATCWNDRDNNLGSDFIIIKGLTPVYRYSLITLTEVDPSTEEMINSDLTDITLKFDGLVYLGNYDEADGELRTFINQGQGLVLPFAAVTPTEPIELEGHVCANTWTLTLPEGYLASLTAPLEIGFTAYDQDGVQLRGTTGIDENSFFNLIWNVAGQFDSVEVNAVGTSPLGNVSKFTVYNEAGVNVSWNIPLEEAIVTCNGETVAHVEEVEFPLIDFGETMTEITLVLDTELTENATYTLSIPASYFVIGEQLATKSSLPVEYEFTIGKGTAVETVGVDIDTVTVFNAEGILMLDSADKSELSTLPAGLYIVNGKKVFVK